MVNEVEVNNVIFSLRDIHNDHITISVYNVPDLVEMKNTYSVVMYDTKAKEVLSKDSVDDIITALDLAIISANRYKVPYPFFN